MNILQNARRTALLLACSAVGSFGLGYSATAAAECSCMCIEGVSYDVCTGFLNTQTVTPACTESLQCPEDPSVTEPVDGGNTDTGSGDGAQPENPDTAGMDCRMRNVYRPDRGRYEPHPVCLPARAAAAHEWKKANREAYLARLDAWRERHADRDDDGHKDRGRGRGRWDRDDDDDDRGRRGRGRWDDRDDDGRGGGRWGYRDDD
jgi:hypothetical protein